MTDSSVLIQVHSIDLLLQNLASNCWVCPYWVHLGTVIQLVIVLRTGSSISTDEVVLLNTVPQQIEILALRLLLGLILLQNIETFLLLKRLITHILEALATSIDHVERPILVTARVIWRDPLLIGRVCPWTLPLLRHTLLKHDVVDDLSLLASNQHSVPIGRLSTSCSDHPGPITNLFLHYLILRGILLNIDSLVLLVGLVPRPSPLSCLHNLKVANLAILRQVFHILIRCNCALCSLSVPSHVFRRQLPLDVLLLLICQADEHTEALMKLGQVVVFEIAFNVVLSQDGLLVVETDHLVVLSHVHSCSFGHCWCYVLLNLLLIYWAKYSLLVRF